MLISHLLYVSYIPSNSILLHLCHITALDGLGDFNIGRQIIQTVKYADDLVLMAKEETVLQGMIDKLIETGRYYGMEMNVEKTKVMRISRQLFPVTVTMDQKQLKNVKCFKHIWVTC